MAPLANQRAFRIGMGGERIDGVLLSAVSGVPSLGALFLPMAIDVVRA